MADIPNSTAGWTCQKCGVWVSTTATASHWCPQQSVTVWPTAATAAAGQPMYWPQGAPPTPLFPDPRLLALQEQIAKALERIADALEGLQNPLRQSCKLAFTSITGAECICDEPRGHDGAHYSRGTYKMENIG